MHNKILAAASYNTNYNTIDVVYSYESRQSLLTENWVPYGLIHPLTQRKLIVYILYTSKNIHELVQMNNSYGFLKLL